MIYKRKNLKDNNLQLEKPQKMSGFKRLEYEMSSDYLISIVETYEKDGTINVTPVTSDHNFSFVEPKLVIALNTAPGCFVVVKIKTKYCHIVE